MGSQRIIDIIKRAEQFHNDLAHYYAELGEHEQSEEVRHALDFMSRHELQLQRCIQEYEKEAPKAIAETWVQSMPDLRNLDMVNKAELHADMSIEEVIAMVMSFDQVMIDIYKHLCDRAISQDLREALEKLLTLEEESERRALRGLQDG